MSNTTFSLTARLLTLSNRAVNAAINAGGQRTRDQTRVYLMSAGGAFSAAIELVFLAKEAARNAPTDRFGATDEATRALELLKSIDDAVHTGAGRALLSMRAETLTEMRAHAKTLLIRGEEARRAAEELDRKRHVMEGLAPAQQRAYGARFFGPHHPDSDLAPTDAGEGFFG